MHNLSVTGDTFLAKRSSKLKRSLTGENVQQKYVGKVIVKGTVSVRNLFQEDASRILVDGRSLALNDLGRTYLLNRTEQEFKTPIKITRSRLRAPHLQTAFLNGHRTEYHLLNKVKQEEFPVSLIFMSAHIDLDLINTEYRSHLANISKRVVRHGDAVNITGLKVFQAPVSVDNLVTNNLNGISMNDFVLKSDLRGSLRLTGRKYFEQIKVSGVAHVTDDLKANVLNGFSLNELLNRNYYLDKLLLRHHLLSTNLVFHALNGFPFEQAFSNLEVGLDRSLIMRKNVIIKGSVQFAEDLQVDTVNGLNWTEYRDSLVFQQERVRIDGIKHFARELIVTKELRLNMINNFDVTDIFSNILSKTRPQIITGSYRFDELRVKNMDVTVINQVPTSAFIDINAHQVTIDGDVAMPAISVGGNAFGSFDVQGEFSWNDLAERIRELPSQLWRNVHVLGNAKWSEGKGTESTESDPHLAYLKSNALRITGNHVISGNVRLSRPIISNMTTRNVFPAELDLDLLIKDGLFRKTISEQVVLAPKSFIVALTVDNIEAASEVSCNKLNGIDVLLLNASLYRRSSGEPLFGPLHFEQMPNFGYLAVRGTVNGLDCGQIYHRYDSPLPHLKTKQLHVDQSLQIREINDMNVEYFLANRVTKHGEALEIFGALEFEDLVLNKEISLQSINGIPIDSLVLKVSERLQAITGNKIIDGDLVLTGPIHLMRLNERQNLIDLYQASILTNLDYNFDDFTVEEAIFEHGLIHQSKEVNSLEEEAKSSGVSLNDRMTDVSRWQAIIDDKRKQTLKRSLGDIETKHLLYLDYNLNKRVVWRETDNGAFVGGNEIYVIGTQPLSLHSCLQEMLLVRQYHEYKDLIFITNTTSNFFEVNLKGWSVRVENYCNSEYRRLRSKITIRNSRLLKNIGLPKFVQQLGIFESTDGTQNTCLLLVHAVDVLANRNEVHLLRLDGENNTIVDVQIITQGIGKILRFFQPTRDNLVIISSDTKPNRHMVNIYMRPLNSEFFVLKKIIEGNYDLFEYVEINSNRHHLMLSCTRCRRIDIYAIRSYSGDILISSNIFQFINLSSTLAKMLPLNFGDDGRYLLIFPNDEPNFYHIYKFSHIQGWQPLTYGYFDNIRFAIPLTRERDRLYRPLKSLQLLLCSDNNKTCKVVKAHLQGVS